MEDGYGEVKGLLMRPARDESANQIEEKKSSADTRGIGSTQRKELFIIIILLAVQIIVTSVDYMPVPFLPYEGGLRGLSEVQVGIIVGLYELSKCGTAPFCDSIVSGLCKQLKVLFKA